MRGRSWLVAGLVWIGVAGGAAAVGGTVTDQAVTLTYHSTHWGGREGASLDGVEIDDDPLVESGWWYRIEGDAREFPLPVPDSEVYLDGKIEATWNNVDGKGFKVVETTWVVDTERPAGGFVTWMRAWNNNQAARQITLFHYLDLDIARLEGDDSGRLVTPRFLEISDAGGETADYKAAGATHFQAAPFPQLQDGLNNASASALDDSIALPGPSDVTAAYQFGPTRVQPGGLTAGWVSVLVKPPVVDAAEGSFAHLHVKGDFLGVLPFPALFGQKADLSSLAYVPMRRTTQLVPLLGAPKPTPASAFAGIDDFDGDLKDEPVFRDTQTGVAYVGLSPIQGAPTLPLSWKLSATGDFNHDGQADIVWRSTVSQKLVVWLMDGETRIGSVVPSPNQAADANWEVAGVADFSRDGEPDLLWYNQTTGKIVMWYLDPFLVRSQGLFTTPNGVGSNTWRVAAVGDYGVGANGGVYGTPDIVWQNDVSHKIVVWHMEQDVRTAGTFTAPDSLVEGTYKVVGPR